MSTRRDRGQWARRISHQDARGWPLSKIRNYIDHAHSKNCMIANRPSRKPCFNYIRDNGEGCSHACYATATQPLRDTSDQTSSKVVSMQCPIDLNKTNSTKLKEKDDGSRSKASGDGGISYKPLGKGHEHLLPKFENVAERFPSTSKGQCVRSLTRNTVNRKTKCSVPVSDKVPASVSRGHFRLIQQDGSQFYSFSVQNSEEMLFARAFKPQSACSEDNCSPDFRYIFHSRKEDELKKGWQCWQFKKDELASIPVAKMKVSVGNRHVDSNRGVDETRFVLYNKIKRLAAAGKKENDDSRMQLSKKNSMIRIDESYVEYLAVAITMSPELEFRWNSANKDEGLRKGLITEAIQESPEDGSQSKNPLHSIDAKESHSAYAPLILNEGLKGCHAIDNQHKPLRIAANVVVILPAGCHSLTFDKDGDFLGPTSFNLLKYWQSGGNCDCGGWDVGCGILVLRAETLTLDKRSTVALTNHDQINWICPGKPLVIYSQDTKRRKLLMIEMIEPGLFFLIFREAFSPLQAFGVAVGICHQQMTLKSR